MELQLDWQLSETHRNQWAGTSETFPAPMRVHGRSQEIGSVGDCWRGGRGGSGNQLAQGSPWPLLLRAHSLTQLPALMCRRACARER